MMDLSAWGVEPQEPPADDDTAEDEEPTNHWPECADCRYAGPEVKARLGQSVALCTACFAEREGLL